MELFSDGLFFTHIIENADSFFGNKLIFLCQSFRFNSNLIDGILSFFEFMEEFPALVIEI